MREIHEPEPFLQQALVEHHELEHAVLGIWRRLIAPPAPLKPADIEALAGSLRRLRHQLDQHFMREEEGGYLEEAITRVPSLATEAYTLQEQHQGFLGDLDAMLSAAGPRGAPEATWKTIRADFEQFSKRLFAHEAAENLLLGRAFNVDLSAENV